MFNRWTILCRFTAYFLLGLMISGSGCTEQSGNGGDSGQQNSSDGGLDEDRDSEQDGDGDDSTFDEQNDKDQDGVLDQFDNCPLHADPDQEDADGDGAGDLCDDDADNDGLINHLDNCPTMVNFSQSDSDGDGLGDLCDDVDDEEAAGESPIQFEPIDIDPSDEDSAGPALVITADMDEDGLIDLVTAWSDSQPVQIGLQQRDANGDVSFNTFSIEGAGPFYRVSGLAVADFDEDGNPDVALSIQNTGFTTSDFIDDGTTNGSVIILFAPDDPADALDWEETNLTHHYECAVQTINDIPTAVASFAYGRDGDEQNYQDLVAADIDEDGDPDIAAAFNGLNEDDDPNKELEVWVNPGGSAARDEEEFIDVTGIDTDGDGIVDDCSLTLDEPWELRTVSENVNDFVDLDAVDIDNDDEIDLVSAAPISQTFRLSWLANGGDVFSSAAELPIGDNDNGLDDFRAIDLDQDGRLDVVAMSVTGTTVHWFKNPESVEIHDFPWEVYNIAQLDAAPTAMDVGDLDGDGALDVVVGSGNNILWYQAAEGIMTSVWAEYSLFEDADSSTQVRSVVIVDVNEDGLNDVVGMLDRQGTNDDHMVWFRNLGD